MKQCKSIHFIGVGGIGMSALAQYCVKFGMEVSGSDRQDSEMLHHLKDLGVKVFVGHKASNIGRAQVVVYTSAVHFDNEELQAALKTGVKVMSRSEMLGWIVSGFTTSVAIAGTHGKTTVTSMLSDVFYRMGLLHTAFIGGEGSHGNFVSGGDTVVAEACEYQRSFLELKPTVGVVLNVEYDHPDCYDNMTELYKAFRKFCNGSQQVLINGDDKFSETIPNALTFGLGNNNLYRAVDIRCDKGLYCYTFVTGDIAVDVRLSVVGRHQVYNSLAVMSVCHILGLPLLQCGKALSHFGGTHRRWERFSDNLFNLIADYAHHPTEIQSSVDTALQCGCNKLWVVFQPHTYSRTKALMKQFARSLSKADGVALLPVYSARESVDKSADSDSLVTLMSNGMLVHSFTDAVKWVNDNAREGDTVLLLGAGDVYELAQLIVKQQDVR